MLERSSRARSADLSPGMQELVDELRRVFSATGQNLRELEAATHFSKSAWGRYLHGDVLIPDQAITELVQLAYANQREARIAESRVLALRELARSQPAPPVMVDRQQSNSPAPAESSVLAVPSTVPAATRDQLQTITGTRRFVSGAVTFALLLGVSGEPTPNSAQFDGHSCYGPSCNGRDPKVLGCDHDARTMPQQRGTLEIRYSCACGAAWLRMRNARVGDILELNNSNGAVQRNTADHGTSTFMVPALPGDKIQACLYNQEGTTCTPKLTSP